MSGERSRTVRPRAVFGLAAVVGCVLLLILGLEVENGAGRAASVTRPAIGRAAASHSEDATASLPPAVIADAVRIVLLRPLFSPSRRPPSVAVSGPQRPRLAGIIVASGGRRAIFAGDGDARGTVVGVGQQAGAWHVMAIDAASVRVSGPDGVRTLRPSRDKNGHDENSGPPDLPAHPSILDLLRSRNAAPDGNLAGGLMGSRLPLTVPLPHTDDPASQQTAPAAPE